MMNISTMRIKQYNSTKKTVIIVNSVPICIVDDCDKIVSNIIAYLNGDDVPIADNEIKKTLTKLRTMFD